MGKREFNIEAIAVCGIVIAATALSLLLKHLLLNADEYVSSITTIISAIADLATLFLAMCAYKKYFIDEKIRDVNLNVIIKIIEELQKLEFIVSGDKYYLFLRFKNNTFYNQHSEYGQVKVFFTEDAFARLCEFVATCKSPFLPQTVNAALSKIDPITGETVKGQGEYAVIGIKMRKSNAEILRLNSTDFTLKEFQDLFYNLRSSIVKWLEENANKVDISF